MILRSMSRKTPSFRELLQYINKPSSETASPGILTRNIYGADGEDLESIAREFDRNHSYLPTRKNGNALYHEVLVFESIDHVSKAHQTEMLIDIADRYLTLRAPDLLAYGRVHLDTDHVHIHLMISSNAPRSAVRKRLSKSQFRTIQSETETYKLQRYPELGDTRLYDHGQRNELNHSGSREFETKLQGLSTGSRLREQISDEIRRAHSAENLARRLEIVGYRFYQRGHYRGIQSIETGHRHRLKTLGVSDECERRIRELELTAKKLDELRSLRKTSLEEEAYLELANFDCEDGR